RWLSLSKPAEGRAPTLAELVEASGGARCGGAGLRPFDKLRAQPPRRRTAFVSQERSEGSLIIRKEMLRCAQHDDNADNSIAIGIRL
ncbi:hypothetical protein CJ255_21480, partial [Candidatus Viridilinea mediisalina]